MVISNIPFTLDFVSSVSVWNTLKEIVTKTTRFANNIFHEIVIHYQCIQHFHVFATIISNQINFYIQNFLKFPWNCQQVNYQIKELKFTFVK